MMSRYEESEDYVLSPFVLQNDAGASLRQGYCDGRGW